MRAGAQVAIRGRRRHPVRIGRGAALVFVLAALGFPGGAMADWRIYGHDLANSRNAGVNGPSAGQVDSLPKAWTFKSPTGDFTGTPVIADGVLVAGNNGGGGCGLGGGGGGGVWGPK